MFFKVIYYFIGLLLVLINLYRLSDTNSLNDIFDINKKYRESKEEGKDFDLDTLDKDMKAYLYFIFGFGMVALIWLGIGIFTYNWVIIIAFFFISFLLKKIYRNSKKYRDSFIALTKTQIMLFVITVLFAIINTFHLHIDFIKLIFG